MTSKTLRAVFLVLLASLVFPSISSFAPRTEARNPSPADLYISEFTLYRFDWWDIYWPPPEVFFEVTYHGVVDSDTRTWRTDDISVPSLVPEMAGSRVVIGLHDQPQFDLDTLSSDRSLNIEFVAYKKGLWGLWNDQLGEKHSYTFHPGHTPVTLGNRNIIEFNVELEWVPQVTPPPSPTPTQAKVVVYSMSREYAGQDPDTHGTDLEAVLSMTYVLNGQSDTMQSATPILVRADVGSEIILNVNGAPSGWDFACAWDNYGHQFYQYPSCRLSSVVYSGWTKIVAFFDKQLPPPPPPPPPPPTSTQSIVIRSIDDQFWNSWKPYTNDLGAWVGINYILGGYVYASGGYTPFSIQVDQGTQITVRDPQLSGWSFARWNWYGDTYYHTDTIWSTSARGFKPEGYNSNFLAALYIRNSLFAVLPVQAPSLLLVVPPVRALDFAMAIGPALLSANTDHILVWAVHRHLTFSLAGATYLLDDQPEARHSI